MWNDAKKHFSSISPIHKDEADDKLVKKPLWYNSEKHFFDNDLHASNKRKRPTDKPTEQSDEDTNSDGSEEPIIETINLSDEDTNPRKRKRPTDNDFFLGNQKFGQTCKKSAIMAHRVPAPLRFCKILIFQCQGRCL